MRKFPTFIFLPWCRGLMVGSLDGWSDSKSLESNGNTRKPSLWSPALALPQCLRRMLTRSRHHLRCCLLEDLRAYLPFTSQGPPRASTLPIPRHHSKRRLPPHKWGCSRSPLLSPRHTVWWALFQWTRAKMLIVSRTVRGKISGLTALKFGYDQNHRRRWTLMVDDPRDSLICGFDLLPHLFSFTEAGWKYNTPHSRFLWTIHHIFLFPSLPPTTVLMPF